MDARSAKDELVRESQEPFDASAWKRHRGSRMAEPLAKKQKNDIVAKLDFAVIVLEHCLLVPSTGSYSPTLS